MLDCDVSIDCRVRSDFSRHGCGPSDTFMKFAKFTLAGFIPTFALTAIILVLVLTACGTQRSSVVPIAVTFTTGFTPPGSMAPSATVGIAATVANDNQNAGVTWSVTCSNTPCGAFSPATTPSTTPTTYTAPATAPTGGSVTVTATSVTDKTKFATATIDIT